MLLLECSFNWKVISQVLYDVGFISFIYGRGSSSSRDGIGAGDEIGSGDGIGGIGSEDEIGSGASMKPTFS